MPAILPSAAFLFLDQIFVQIDPSDFVEQMCQFFDII